MPDEEKDKSPNPPFQRPHLPEHPLAAKWRLYQWHKRAGSLGLWRDLYPEKHRYRSERGRGASGRDED